MLKYKVLLLSFKKDVKAKLLSFLFNFNLIFILKNIFYLYKNGGFFRFIYYLCVCACVTLCAPNTCSAQEGHKKALESLVLEF